MLALTALLCAHAAIAFVAPARRARPTRANAIVVVDHVNLNHEKGRHDLLKAFYFDLLGFAPDPRKAENIEKGKKTLWANAGITQLHLPEGFPHAQPLDGRMTVAYPSLDRFDEARLEAAAVALGDTKFQFRPSPDGYDASCPWGTPLSIKVDPEASDPRGSQPGPATEPLGIVDIALHVDRGADLAGVKRFYTRVLGVPEADATLLADQLLVLKVGPTQTLTFATKPTGRAKHVDLGEDEEHRPTNAGPHVSMYVSDLGACYDAADALGLAFVNYRFKRRAHSKEEALDQCMFRVIDVVDPDAPEKGPILQIEHEIRSCVKTDGSKYKSCPLDEV